MSEYQVEGPELKKLITLAKRKPLAFAFNPAKNDEDHYFGMDRKKPADLLGRDAKKNGEGSKVAFGMATVEGKQMTLTCEQVVPGIAKKLKRYLKTQKLTMNIEVLDANGAVVDSDITDIPDDPDEEITDGEDIPPAFDQKDLIARLNLCKPKVQAAPENLIKPLSKLFTDTAGLIKAGDGAGAEANLQKLEAALAKIAAAAEGAPATPQLDAKAIQAELVAVGGRVKALPPEQAARLAKPMKQAVDFFKAGDLPKTQAATAKISAVCDTLEAAAPPKADGPADLAKRAKTLRDQIAALPDPAQSKALMAEFAKGVGQIKAGDLNAATATFDRVEAEVAAAPAETSDNAEQEWAALWSSLEPRVTAEIKQDGPLSSTLSARKMAAEEAVIARDFAKALNIGKRLEAMLDEAAEARVGADEAKKQRVNAIDFSKARITWRDTKAALQAEMKTLADTIIADLKGGDVEGIESAAQELASYLDPITDTLETALNKLAEATDPADIATRKQSCIAIINDLETQLEQGIFAEIDDNNGFASVSVQKKALSALDAVAAEINKTPEAA
ncbi:hypothetical protein Z945_628 [Sulfitobacter noctilucae]|uniref:hypothetical protein n=1 Tax=Sulfitobacter noctilucae TaxID=1342302 RepID=UPI00046AE326|nr:hypothetical protein [Sulfitobacter noctilucae]KIN65584.1 hypothetical protein Z945_628 [Sulfitobacter noctilucae]